MRKFFIRIGTLGLNVSDIVSYNTDLVKQEAYFDEQDDGWVSGYQPIHVVRLVTCALDESAYHDFEHGTPEAVAILAWLEAQSEDLTAKEEDERCVSVE